MRGRFEAQRKGSSIAMDVYKLDDFSQVNDIYGHHCGGSL